MKLYKRMKNICERERERERERGERANLDTYQDAVPDEVSFMQLIYIHHLTRAQVLSFSISIQLRNKLLK